MAVETAPAFQFYVKEWRSSRPVMRMTFAQRGMYLEMLIEQWENLSLPDSPTECAVLIGGSVEEWVSAWPVLRARFVDRRRAGRPIITDHDAIGRIHNLRLERVRKELRAFRKVARSGGIKRALTAKRGKDGTYSPAGEPAESPAGTPAGTPAGSPAAIQPSASTASASATASAIGEKGTRPRPPSLVAKRNPGAAWEGPRGLYVPQKLHNQFLEWRKGDAAALWIFYGAVADAYATGSRKDHEPGADMFKFWSARYDEKWPATAVEKPPAAGPPTSRPASESPYARTGTEGA